jgi:hypothetical protein
MMSVILEAHNKAPCSCHKGVEVHCRGDGIWMSLWEEEGSWCPDQLQ